MDLLGFRKLAALAGRHLFLRAGGSVLLLFRAAETLRGKELPPHGASGPVHVCFAVPRDAFEEWIAFLPASGVTLLQEESWPGGGRSVYFRDPDGNLLELADRDFWPK